MNNELVKKLIDLATRYDRFTAYIDNYRQEQEAEKRNASIEAEFIQTCSKLGLNVSSGDFYVITSSTGTVHSTMTIEEAVMKMIKEKTNNTSTNGGSKMKNDYTLNGKLKSTTWEQFRQEMKNRGIDVTRKKFVELVEEFNKLESAKTANENAVVLDQPHGDYIVKNIVKASFIASKGDSKGMRIVTMKKLFGIIRTAYIGDPNSKEKLEESFIKEIVNQLIKKQYIMYKRYESGAMIFYPTVKAAEYVANHK